VSRGGLAAGRPIAHDGAMFDPHRLALVSLVALAVALPSRSAPQEEADPLVRAVLAYELTLQRTESYVAALKDLADFAKKNPKAMEPFRGGSAKTRPMSLEEKAASLEKVVGIKAILDRHALRGIDLMVLPIAMMQAQMIVIGWSQGREFPADKLNLRNAEAVKAAPARFEALATEAATLRGSLAGK
jgi:hypothetical protein